MSTKDYLTETARRETYCVDQSRETLLQWAVGAAAVYGGTAALAHYYYPPFTRINFRFKVIPVCMATLATAYLVSEKKLNSCRRELDSLAYDEELKIRMNKLQEKRKQQQQQQQQKLSHQTQQPSTTEPIEQRTTTTEQAVASKQKQLPSTQPPVSPK